MRTWKDCGLKNLPFEGFARNQAWVAASLVAGALLAWTQLTCFKGELAKAEPKRSATACCTWPPNWPTTPASSSSISTSRGPGPVNWPQPSPACTRPSRSPTGPGTRPKARSRGVTNGKRPKHPWFGAPENSSGRREHSIGSPSGAFQPQPEPGRMIEAKRTMAKADAAVAEATVQNRVAESDLDVALKQEQLVEARLRNERLALENAHLEQALSADQQRRTLVERAMQRGQLDIVDALQALDPADARALGELGRRSLELEEHWERDDTSE